MKATRLVASTLGVLVGLAGIDRGIFEMLQGDTPPTSLMIAPIGPHQRLWEHGTEWAITIVPSLLWTGILAGRDCGAGGGSVGSLPRRDSTRAARADAALAAAVLRWRRIRPRLHGRPGRPDGAADPPPAASGSTPAHAAWAGCTGMAEAVVSGRLRPCLHRLSGDRRLRVAADRLLGGGAGAGAAEHCVPRIPAHGGRMSALLGAAAAPARPDPPCRLPGCACPRSHTDQRSIPPPSSGPGIDAHAVERDDVAGVVVDGRPPAHPPDAICKGE